MSLPARTHPRDLPARVPDDEEDSPFPMAVAIGVGFLSGAVLIGIPFGLALWPLWR